MKELEPRTYQAGAAVLSLDSNVLLERRVKRHDWHCLATKDTST